MLGLIKDKSEGKVSAFMVDLSNRMTRLETIAESTHDLLEKHDKAASKALIKASDADYKAEIALSATKNIEKLSKDVEEIKALASVPAKISSYIWKLSLGVSVVYALYHFIIQK